MKLSLVPLTLTQVNALMILHRHHKPVQGHRFSIGAQDETGLLHGAAVVGRPVARMTNQYRVAEVTRLVTDGTRNCCSLLYAACARAAEAMGFDAIQTFILEEETGLSLKCSGWSFVSLSGGGDWTRESKPGRRQDQPQGKKQKWEKRFRLDTDKLIKLPENLDLL